jgi:copper transport protein
VVLLGAVLVLLLLGDAQPAFAHAALRESDPRDGAVLKSAPRDITLTFTESVSLLDDSLRVLDPDNRAVETDEPGRAGKRSDTVRVNLPPNLADGTYTIAWRVVSADSHPVSGALIFSVGEPSATGAVATAPTEDPVVESLHNITRYVAYGGLALLIGVTAFAAALLGGGLPEALRRLMLNGWWTLLGGTAVLFLIRGPYERGTGIADAVDPSVLAGTLQSRPGTALLARLVLLAGAFFLIRGAGAARKAEAPRQKAVLAAQAALCVGLALTWASAEHASAGIQVPVAMASSVLHLLAMAVWLGGLTALLIMLYRAPERVSATVVARFSRLALGAVAVLVVTGVYQSWRGLGSWDAFSSTRYGELLAAKLGAVVLLLVAAGFSRRWTAGWVMAGAEARRPERRRVPAEARVAERVGGGSTATITGDDGPAPADDDHDTVPTTETSTHTRTDVVGEADDDRCRAPGAAGCSAPAGDDGHRHALRRSVLAEALLAVVVMVITTVLTGTLPGRAAAESAPGAGAAAPGEPTASSNLIPFNVGSPSGNGRVQLDLAPGTVGRNSIQAVVFGPDGGIATVPELRLTFTLHSQEVGPIDAKLENKGGYWGTDTLRLPLPGTWTMKITIRTTDIDQVTVERNVTVS